MWRGLEGDRLAVFIGIIRTEFNQGHNKLSLNPPTPTDNYQKIPLQNPKFVKLEPSEFLRYIATSLLDTRADS